MTSLPEQTISSPPLLELLPRAIAAIASLSALGYFVGWRETHAYYTALGATWAAAAIPPLTLLQLSAGTIVTIATAGFLSLVLLIDDTVNTRTLSWACAVTLGIAGIALGLSQGLIEGLSPSNSYTLTLVGSNFYAISAGITLTELVGHLRKSNRKISLVGHVEQSNRKVSSGHLWLLYWFVLPGLFWAPDRLGQARALRDTDAAGSSLPVVTLESNQLPGEWRLVHLIDAKGLLMLVGGSADKRLFKIVDADDVRIINSTIRAKAKK